MAAPTLSISAMSNPSPTITGRRPRIERGGETSALTKNASRRDYTYNQRSGEDRRPEEQRDEGSLR
jgi:hypothetical protein